MKKTLVIISMLLLLPAGSYSQANYSKESLRGLRGVFVKVLPIQKDAEADGLSVEQIKKAVETQLRNAGITTHSSPDSTSGSANLAIVIDTIKHPQGPYIYTVTISLLQEVYLVRSEKQDVFPAETWSKKALGLTTPSRIGLIQEPIREKLKEFISDYIAVNPKS